MIDFSGKTYWLIGASEGLGRSLARDLAQAGAIVVLSARNQERLQSLQKDLPNARIAPLDVTDLKAIRRVIKDIGPVDGIIYNAGTYDPMSSGDWETDSALTMAEVNFMGAMRVLGETVPGMVAAGHGDITLIGSLSGYRGLPSAIGYGASKAALISLAETMRFDLRNTGVVVRIVNPGFIKTRLTQKNDFAMPMLMSPDDAARRVVKAMRSRRFRTDFPAPFSWVMRSLAYLPDLLVYRGR